MAEANADQTTFWNEQMGRNWVRSQSDVDTVMAAVGAAVLDACAARPGERALDIGCGAGAIALALAEAVGPAGSVTGADVSAPLLERARARAVEDGIGNLDFVLADAQDHDFALGGFDLVASRFGVMFFADPVAAFANLRRAVRPGGRLAFVAWSGAAQNPFFAVPQSLVNARFGLEPQPPSDEPGPMAFRDIGRVTGILSEAGWREPRGEEIAVDLHHPDGVAGMTSLCANIGPLVRGVRDAGAGPEALDELLARLADALAPFAADDGIRVPARINRFTATRP